MLDPQEYAPGRRVRLSGEELHIRGTVADSSFNQWLIVSSLDSHVAVLIAAPAVAEEAEAVDPDTVTDVSDVTEDQTPTHGPPTPQAHGAPTPAPPGPFTPHPAGG